MKRPVTTLAAVLLSGSVGACNLILGVDGYEAAPNQCAAPADCPVPAAACLEATCVDGACGDGPRALGAACSVGAGTTCDGSGLCIECLPPEKVPASMSTGNGCGGPSCAKCPDGQRCAVDGDCLSKRCIQRVCSTLG